MKKSFCLLLVLMLLTVTDGLLAQGTGFTYQGRLQNGGSPASGNYDFTFALFSTNSTSGSHVGVTRTNLDVGVTNGLFTVTLDFGSVFTGNATWLAIGVRTNGGGTFMALNPLQELTPTPYAVMAGTASNLSGTLPAAQLNGTIASANLPNGLGGNGNTADGNWATVAGGYNNTASADYATVAGGENNTASAKLATVAGGVDNTASGLLSFAAGNQAFATNQGAFVWADSQGPNFYSTNNDSFNVQAHGGARFVTGGAGMSVDGSFIAGYAGNAISSGVVNGFIGGGGDALEGPNVVAGNYGAALGGAGNTASGIYSTVMGAHSTASGNYSIAEGGTANASAPFSTAMGNFVTASGRSSFAVGGGNTASGGWSTAMGGGTTASGSYSMAAGFSANATNDGAFVWGDSQNAPFASANNDSFNVRAQGGARFVTSGAGLGVDGPVTATSFSGALPTAQLSGTIDPGNLPNGLGGSGNTASGPNATVGGGDGNTASAQGATVSGGHANIATNLYATVGGGANNTAGGYAAMVIGGDNNTASGTSSTVSGDHNTAGGLYSFAAGHRAQAVNDGTFVWADSSSDADFASTNNDSFNVRAQGGAHFVTSGTGLSVDGPVTATSFSGNGGGLTSLPASQLTGPVADARLSANVALRAGGNTFTGNQIITNGSVGIGTTTPANKLDVQGSADFTGNVGIGTTNPGYALQIVKGGAQFVAGQDTSHGLKAYNWSPTDQNIDVLGSNPQLHIGRDNPLASTTFESGNVGIGTNAPAAKLEVNGNVQVDGALAANYLRAPGAGINTATYAFTQMAVPSNTVNFYTIIYNPIANNNPNAIIFVSHNDWVETNPAPVVPVDILYNGTYWAIYNVDKSSMPLGRAFNVLIVKP